eukprot:84235_1
MGRKKILIDRLGEESARRTTFNKRRVGLVKKGMELSILCDTPVLVVTWNEDGTMYEYASTGDVHGLMDKVRSFEGDVVTYTNNHLEELIPGKASSFTVGTCSYIEGSKRIFRKRKREYGTRPPIFTPSKFPKLYDLSLRNSQHEPQPPRSVPAHAPTPNPPQGLDVLAIASAKLPRRNPQRQAAMGSGMRPVNSGALHSYPGTATSQSAEQEVTSSDGRRSINSSILSVANASLGTPTENTSYQQHKPRDLQPRMMVRAGERKHAIANQCIPGATSQCIPRAVDQCNPGTASQYITGPATQSAPLQVNRYIPGPTTQSATNQANKYHPEPTTQSAPSQVNNYLPGSSNQSATNQANRYIPGPTTQSTPNLTNRYIPGSGPQFNLGASTSVNVSTISNQYTTNTARQRVQGTRIQPISGLSNQYNNSDLANRFANIQGTQIPAFPPNMHTTSNSVHVVTANIKSEYAPNFGRDPESDTNSDVSSINTMIDSDPASPVKVESIGRFKTSTQIIRTANAQNAATRQPIPIEPMKSEAGVKTREATPNPLKVSVNTREATPNPLKVSVNTRVVTPNPLIASNGISHPSAYGLNARAYRSFGVKSVQECGVPVPTPPLARSVSAN